MRRLIELARDEDLGPGGGSAGDAAGDMAGDVTSEVTIDASATCRGRVVLREEGVVAGLAALLIVLEVFAPDVAIELHMRDGDRGGAATSLATVAGPTRQVLAAERTMLNLVGRSCGIATRAAAFAAAAGGEDTRGVGVYHTRKTTPGARLLEIYAARCGGARLHRAGLYDAVLVKDNHVAGVGDLAKRLGPALATVRDGRELMFVEVEVDSLVQLRDVLAMPEGAIDIVLLDNMTPDQLREAVGVRDRTRPEIRLEASGGVTLETIGDIARTGVDRISIGSITHGARALDVGLDFD